MCEFLKIQNYLSNFQPESCKSLSEDMFSKGEYMVSWFVNNLCNFSCSYCGHYKKEHPEVGKFSIEHIVKSFLAFGNTGHIIITGGEPFLFPSFVQLCLGLTKYNYISVNTNLSQKNIIDFSNTIDPERVIMINAGAHFEFRKKNNIALDDFICNYNLLQNKGFNIIASYVVHPEHLNEMEKNIEYLKSLGVTTISAKTFSGIYNDKKYPQAYTADELNRIENYMSGQIDMPDYLKYYKFKGNNCLAGKDFFSIDPAGNVYRCNSDDTFFGNIFNNSFKPSGKTLKCKTDECSCPYQGMIYSSKKRQSIFSKLIK